MPFFDYLAENRELGETFDRAMAAATPGRVMPLLAHDWTGIDRVADVGQLVKNGIYNTIETRASEDAVIEVARALHPA
jgi:hypothetical protein